MQKKYFYEFTKIINRVRFLWITGFIFKSVCLIVLLQNSSEANGPLNIAFIDTGFCPDKIQITNIKIENAIDLTGSVKLDCKKMVSNKNSPRFHGQLVLDEFLKYFDNKKKSLHLFPLIVFNEKGDQKKEYWLRAIDWVKENKIDVVVTAAGFITSEKVVAELPAVWFIPSGRVTPQITKESRLFPQSLAPQKNLFVIGDFYDGQQVLYDQGLLFQDQIDYYFPSGVKGFVGTSRAVAEASARALNLCPLKTMRDCLKKMQKVYIDNLSQRKIQTF